MGTLSDYIELYRDGKSKEELALCAGLSLLQTMNMNGVLCRLGVISREDIDERRKHINRGRVVDEQYTAMGDSFEDVVENIRKIYRSGISGFKFASEYNVRNSHGVYAMYTAFRNMGVFTENDIVAHASQERTSVTDLPWQKLDWPVNLLKFVASRTTSYLYYTDDDLHAVEEIYSKMEGLNADIVKNVMIDGLSVQAYANALGKSKQYIYSVLKTISTNIYQKMRYCFTPTVSSILDNYGVSDVDCIFDVQWKKQKGFQTVLAVASDLAACDLYIDGMEYWEGDDFRRGAMALYCFKHNVPVKEMLHRCGLVVDYEINSGGSVDLDNMSEVQQFITYYSHVEVLSVKHIAILLGMDESEVRAVIDA